MRISDWSSDVCSSDLIAERPLGARHPVAIFDRGQVERLIGGAEHLEEMARAVALVAGTVGAQHDDRVRQNDLFARRERLDRQSGVQGKRVSVRVDLGGRRILKKKKTTHTTKNT